MYLTTDPDGRELCLRPDLTIPVSRDYLASPRPAKRAGFCYLGPVFRHRGDAPAEFLQAGIESFGRADTAAADAEMLALGLEATAHYGIAAPEIRMGDVGLFAALVAALDLAPAWKRRLVKDFNRAEQPRATISTGWSARRRRASARNIRACWPRWPAPTRRPRMRWSPTCCRSPASPRSADARSARSPSASSSRRRSAQHGAAARDARADRALPRHRGDPGRSRRRAARARAPTPSSISTPRSICSKAAPASSPRAASMSRASGSRPRSAAASTTTPASCSSCTIRSRRVDRQLVAGGRYDGLLTRLGAHEPIPAVGFAVWIERLDGDAGARHERAVRHRRAVEGPPAGERRSVLRARRARPRQAARRARLSRRDRRHARRRGRVSLGLRHHRAARAGRGASRRHRRGPGARDDSRRRRSAWC